jgi:psp operon transcriptional activator
MAYELGRDTPRFSPAVARALRAHPWRGNVRELKNVVERAVYRATGDCIEEIVFDPFDTPHRLQDDPSAAAPPAAPAAPEAEAPPVADFKAAVAGFEVRLLREALHQHRHQQRAAASALGLTYDQFRGLYRKHRAALE